MGFELWMTELPPTLILSRLIKLDNLGFESVHDATSHSYLKHFSVITVLLIIIWKPRNHIKKRGFEPIRSRQSWIPCPSENCAPRFSLNKGDAFASFMPDFFYFWVLKNVDLEISFMWWTYPPPRSSIVRLRMTLPCVWHALSEDKRLKGSAY